MLWDVDADKQPVALWSVLLIRVHQGELLAWKSVCEQLQSRQVWSIAYAAHIVSEQMHAYAAQSKGPDGSKLTATSSLSAHSSYALTELAELLTFAAWHLWMLQEAANIVSNATEHSLVLIDELGCATSTQVPCQQGIASQAACMILLGFIKALNTEQALTKVSHVSSSAWLPAVR